MCRVDDTKAVELVRAAADLEATMDKHPATPSPVLPSCSPICCSSSTSLTRH